MAKTLHLDPVGEAELQRTKDGIELFRTARITGTSGATAVDKLLDALATEGLPAIGDALAADKPWLRLQRIIPREGRDGEIDVGLVYSTQSDALTGSAGYARIRVGAEVEQIEVKYDYLGQEYALQYHYPADYKANEKLAGTDSEVAQARWTIDRSRRVVTYTRTEAVSPAVLQDLYLDTVNAAGWNAFPADAAGTWRCISVEAEANYGGVSWEVTYVFKHRAEGWYTVVAWEDPNTGKPPADLIEGLGWHKIVDYRQQSYTPLGLPQIGPNPPQRPAALVEW